MVECEEGKIAREELETQLNVLKVEGEAPKGSIKEVERLQAEQDVLFEELAASEEAVAESIEKLEEKERKCE